MRIRDRLTFVVEQALIRGPIWRLAVIALLIVLVSLAAGSLISFWSPESLPWADGVWWAFLRLSDPGYLGDDQGAFKRVVSTVVTILGYVLFMGSLVAIMTQGLTQRIRTLERGLTPIAWRDHLVVLGWTNRTPTVLKELLSSEGRARRFLQRIGAGGGRLRIAVLAEDIGPELAQELKDRLGSLWSPHRVVLRSGSPLRQEHLRRVAFKDAAAIILPAGDFKPGQGIDADTHTIKALMTIGSRSEPSEDQSPPLLVAEVFDEREVPVAKALHGGPVEIVESDRIVARILAQALRYPGLCSVAAELLEHNDGHELYVRYLPELAGVPFSDLATRFSRAIPIGVVRTAGNRQWRPLLNPPPTLALEQRDGVVFVAGGYEHTAATEGRAPVSPDAPPIPDDAPPGLLESLSRRVLILGWNQRAPALLGELAHHREDHFVVDIVSMVPLDQREARLADRGMDLEGLEIHHQVMDSTNLAHIRRCNPETYDCVVILASERVENEAESDARTILGYLLLRQVIPEGTPTPRIIAELTDAGNVELFEQRDAEVVVSPQLLSHLLAQVALRQELHGVFNDLFGTGGAEIRTYTAQSLGLEEKEVTFQQIKHQMAARQEIALGLRFTQGAWPADTVRLNPPLDQPWTLSAQDEIVVLGSTGLQQEHRQK